MTLFKSQNVTGRLRSGAMVLVAVGLLASAAGNAQSTDTAPEPPPAGADTAAATAEPVQPDTPAAAADRSGRSKAKPRMQKLAIGGLSIPTTARLVKRPKSKQVSPYHGMEETAKARQFYAAAWGVDKLRAHYTSSGNLIRFTFRVLQPKLARPLADHEANPYLFAPHARAVLQVPSMEKIGQLRQLGNLQPDKEYWMVFSNKGNLVRPGDRVDVIIGKFHADRLLVE